MPDDNTKWGDKPGLPHRIFIPILCAIPIVVSVVTTLILKGL